MAIKVSTTLVVKYICKGCHIGPREVSVRYREKDEDIGAFLEEAVMPAIHKDHRETCPRCDAMHCDLMIPFAGAEYLGGPPTH